MTSILNRLKTQRDFHKAYAAQAREDYGDQPAREEAEIIDHHEGMAHGLNEAAAIVAKEQAEMVRTLRNIGRRYRDDQTEYQHQVDCQRDHFIRSLLQGTAQEKGAVANEYEQIADWIETGEWVREKKHPEKGAGENLVASSIAQEKEVAQ